MTTRQTERRYDDTCNEGGEGYNPLREARQEREWETERARLLALDAKPADQLTLDECYERRSRAVRYVESRSLTDVERADLDAIKLRIQAIRAAAGWTREATAERRAAWNARKVTPAMRVAVEREMGWTFNDLRAAIEAYAD